MSRPVVFRPEAEADLADAVAWYEERRPGLGLELLLSVEASLEAIRSRPDSFPVMHGAVRRALLRRFPYGVFYLVEREAIVVLAVFHAKRDPRLWRDRTAGGGCG